MRVSFAKYRQQPCIVLTEMPLDPSCRAVVGIQIQLGMSAPIHKGDCDGKLRTNQNILFADGNVLRPVRQHARGNDMKDAGYLRKAAASERISKVIASSEAPGMWS